MVFNKMHRKISSRIMQFYKKKLFEPIKVKQPSLKLLTSSKLN